MGFFRRIAGILGFSKDDAHEVKDDNEDVDSDIQAPKRVHMQETGLPRKGFSVPIQVSVERSHPTPLLLPSGSGDGGLQGLSWYAKRLRIDGDGDVAHEFIDEVLSEISAVTDHRSLPPSRFQANYRTRPVKIKNQIISQEGKIQQCVEVEGRLQWV